MADLFQAFEQPEMPQTLEPVRLSIDATLLLLFTTDIDLAKLHFVKDPGNFGYVVCPGENCPMCYTGKRPKEFVLLPALDVERRAVGILRIDRTLGTGALSTVLLPLLRKDGQADKLYLISRDGARHTVEVRPLSEEATRFQPVINGFLKARQDGLHFTSAFATPTAKALGDLPSVRAQLDLMGGWPLDRADTDDTEQGPSTGESEDDDTDAA